MSTPSTDIDITKYLDASGFLAAVYRARKDERGRYSYEAFAVDLGFGRNSYMHQIISGARALTEKAGRRMADALELRGARRKYFLALVRRAAAKTAAAQEEALSELLDLRAAATTSDLDRAQLEYFGEWYHPVVRELVTFPGFSPDPQWIARHVQPAIKPEQAAQSFKLLQRIGYVVFDPDAGRWVQAQPVLEMPPEVRSLVLARYHQQMLDLAKDAVTRIPAREREVGALTLSLSAEEFQELKARLIAFRKELIQAFGETKGAEKVAQLNMQLFATAQAAQVEE